jgi:GSCFA family
MRERREGHPETLIAAFTEERPIHFEIDRHRQHAEYTWFRGDHCNFNPKHENLRTAQDVTSHVLRGWLPEAPVIGPQTRIAAFGSCFAQNISDWLAQRNYAVLTRKDGGYSSTYVVRFGEGMVNTFALRQQFEWAFEGRRIEGELWHGYDARAFGYDEDIRVATRAVFDQTDLFIITLGLAEVWYDSITGGVFWRAVPRDKYDPARHKFRVSTVEENRDNIRAIYDLIRAYRPEAKVVFTLSPIPLVATFRPVPCIPANSVSKAILRAALDEVLQDIQLEGHAFYWPSYEIIMDVFDCRWLPDRRHVKQEVLDFVMTLFEVHWCHGAPRMVPEEAWARARLATRGLPRTLANLLIPVVGWWGRRRAQSALRYRPQGVPAQTIVRNTGSR